MVAIFSCLYVPILSLTFFPLYHSQKWVPGPGVQKLFLYHVETANQLLFCDTVNSEKFRDVKLKHFYTSLLCPPIISELSSKLWLQRFPTLKTLSALKEDRWEKYLAMPETWASFRGGWKMETKTHPQSIQQRTCPFKVKTFFLWVILGGFFTGGRRVPPIRALSEKGKLPL